MTSIQSVLAAFGIILVDLLGRAGLDKVLAIAGDPTMVAHWAQLQSVVELVSTVALAGILQGLTVLIAQVRTPSGESGLLGAALKLGSGASLAVALVVLMVVAQVRGEIEPDMFMLAALTGCIMVIPATLNAYWLGKHQQQRMLGLALLGSVVVLLVAIGAWFGLSLRNLLLVQCFMLAIIACVIWRYLRKLAGRKLSPAGDDQAADTRYLQKLIKFVPVGLTIGIMSPVSMLLIRGTLAESLSWSEVGYLQALWRSAEWVTATSAGVLSLVFLPRLSATYGSARFWQEIVRAGAMVLIPAAFLLLLICFFQRALLATLYDGRFVVSDMTAALFMLGSWVRIFSWLFLFGLFSSHRTILIMTGEVLSLPFFALLLWLFADGMTLERAALLYLSSFLAYLCFNAIGLAISSRETTTAGLIKQE